MRTHWGINCGGSPTLFTANWMEYRSSSDIRRGDGYYKLRIITQEGGARVCGRVDGYGTEYVRKYSVGGWWGLRPWARYGPWTCELWSCFGLWRVARVRSRDGALFVVA